MFRNVYFDYKANKICLWETINGNRMYDEIDWCPYIYVPDEKGSIKTIDDISVKKLEFDTYRKYKVFNEDKSLIKYEDKVKPELQFLAERYYNIPDDDIIFPKLRIASFDIECLSDGGGFPSPEKAEGVITAISVDINNEVTCFGIKSYEGQFKENFVYCKTEEILLKKFFEFMNVADIDILTGWNIMGFDIPYLYTRTNKLFGNNNRLFRKFSPIEKINVWEKKDKSGFNFDFAGISVLDYIDVYKKYTIKNQESFKLDFIANDELNEHKLEYEGTLTELYENDWERYIDYNIQDVKLIWKLDKKLKYINLIQSLSLISKCPMKFHDKVTNVLEGIFLTYYRRNRLCAPKLKGGKSEWFEAGFVKESQKGIHNWVVDFDVTSMYPHIMMSGNMSPETYFGCIKDISELDVIKYTKNREFPEFNLEKDDKIKMVKGNELEQFNLLLKDNKFSIAPNGSIFNTTKEGIVPIIEKIFFEKRKETKNKMLKLKENNGEQNKIDELNVTQLAIKVGILNSLFGALSTPYFRLYNIRIAEAITSCGRHINKASTKFINNFLNNKTDKEEFVDYVIGGDTDSVFVSIGGFINDTKKFKTIFNKKDTKGKVNFILDICKILSKQLNIFSFEELQLKEFASQEFEYKINWKQEIVAPSILLVAKKKYGAWIINNEGKECDEIFIRGLDIIRSESSKEIKNRLKDVMTDILKNSNEDELRNKIIAYKKEIRQLSLDDIAGNISINNIEKYIDWDTGPKKGCPWHVKGVYTNEKLLDKYNLHNKYESVHEGNKAKVIYLKKNKYGFETLTYDNKYPSEFTVIQPDIEKMIDKFFVHKIKMLLEPCNKLHVLNENENMLNLFF